MENNSCALWGRSSIRYCRNAAICVVVGRSGGEAQVELTLWYIWSMLRATESYDFKLTAKISAWSRHKTIGERADQVVSLYPKVDGVRNALGLASLRKVFVQ